MTPAEARALAQEARDYAMTPKKGYRVPPTPLMLCCAAALEELAQGNEDLVDGILGCVSVAKEKVLHNALLLDVAVEAQKHLRAEGTEGLASAIARARAGGAMP